MLTPIDEIEIIILKLIGLQHLLHSCDEVTDPEGLACIVGGLADGIKEHVNEILDGVGAYRRSFAWAWGIISSA